MPHVVETNGQIIPFGNDVMNLNDSQTGQLLGTASRTEQGQWLIHVDGVDDITADTRSDAINALQTQVMADLGLEGFSATFPVGLRDMP